MFIVTAFLNFVAIVTSVFKSSHQRKVDSLMETYDLVRVFQLDFCQHKNVYKLYVEQNLPKALDKIKKFAASKDEFEFYEARSAVERIYKTATMVPTIE